MLVLAIAAAAGATFAIFYLWPPRLTPVSRETLAKLKNEEPLELE